ncbi:MAG TPA: protein phosphatase 2C domain-containing protein [Flavisolibacter sp.]|nr:protein phosphatase 2C domain-containing protein [Flavisolibacter sp.]
MTENFFGITNTGKVRDNNEDAFIAERLSNGWIIACVIDGVGGYEGGEVAAEIARTTILQKLQQNPGDVLQAMKESMQLANQNIYNEKLNGKGNNQMACVVTLTMVDVENNQFYYAHVGDTRLYLLRDGSLVKVTKDHSFVGFLEDSGRLSEKEAMLHPKRNEINKALGFDVQMGMKDDYIETGSSPFLPGDMLMLCSDGLTDLVNNETMNSILAASKTLQDKSEALINAANNAGGKDNITVVLVANDKKPLKVKATKPVVTKKNESNEEVTAVAPTGGTTETAYAPRRKRSNAALLALLLISLLLAGACYWLWTKNKDLEASLPKPPPAKILNAGEKKLSDSLGLASRMFQMAPGSFGESVIVSDTLFVRQDTLHINGNGIVLHRDSAYDGPAIKATVNNKILILENIVFKDFTTAILLQGKGIELRNVQFQNVTTPVQRQLFFPINQPLTGFLKDTIIIQNDSLPTKQ